MHLSKNAVKVLESRYLLRGETPEKLFKRVAKAVSNSKKEENIFYNIMKSLDFLPNSPTLMNAGTKLSQLSACFVLPIEDSLQSIYTALKHTALIQQSGGGTGFDFSKIRPKGDIVSTTKGAASGPLSFIELFDKSTDVIKQGGKRRGANQGILSIHHPDIEEFIDIKATSESFKNFNLSISITDSFMKAVQKNKTYPLVHKNKIVKRVSARKIFKRIAQRAWECGDPCLIFIDEINRKHPLKERISATNPCAELPLLPYESCNLGAINLSNMTTAEEIDWPKLEYTVRNAVLFLDNIIDKNRYPLKIIETATKQNRKLGLGVMGFADLLVKLKIPYSSPEALTTAENIMDFIQLVARQKSVELGLEKGNFPNFKRSTYKKRYRYLRNATVTSLQPTGSTSIIAHTSSSIEPIFAVVYTRNILGGKHLLEVHPLFEAIAKKRKFYSKKLIKKISEKGIRIKEVPKDIQDIFTTAHDISPEHHIRIQSVFQRYTDNAISKTINLPNHAKVSDVEKAFMLAYKLKCKGTTVYRYNSKKEQVLNCKTC